jgi:hypothetical protein
MTPFFVFEIVGVPSNDKTNASQASESLASPHESNTDGINSVTYVHYYQKHKGVFRSDWSDLR